MTILVGLCGYRGAGKSEVSKGAANIQGYKHMGFSDTLYQMLIAFGIPRTVVFDKSRWDEPRPELNGLTTRYACDTLGTDWGRNLIGKDIWANRTVAKACEHLRTTDKLVIIDNVRFPEEAQAIINADGVLIAFHRPRLKKDLSREAEQHIDFIQRRLCRLDFVNNSHIDDAVQRFIWTLENAL